MLIFLRVRTGTGVDHSELGAQVLRGNSLTYQHFRWTEVPLALPWWSLILSKLDAFPSTTHKLPSLPRGCKPALSDWGWMLDRGSVRDLCGSFGFPPNDMVRERVAHASRPDDEPRRQASIETSRFGHGVLQV